MLYLLASLYFLGGELLVELGRGVKAGILAGLVYGILYAISVPIFFYFFASLLGFRTSPSLWGGYYVQLIVNPFTLIIGGPILGLILGIIYAFTYNWLPGSRAQTKGVVLTLIVWVIIASITLTTQLPTFLFVSEIEGAQNLQIIMTTWAFILFVLALGDTLGVLWNKFKPKTLPPPVFDSIFPTTVCKLLSSFVCSY
jgi:hypothetical protein